ncbi:MAG: phosphate signaling complex protein PhoU [Desulfobacterales bacterium]
MTKHFIRELEKTKKMILTLGAMAEERVHLAVRAIRKKDASIAQKIISSDYELDEMEVDIEEDCLKILALYQPVAIDLRFLIAMIKINNDLERIGDEAVNIAQRVGIIAKWDQPNITFDYSVMAEKTEKMLKMSLDALVNMDTDLAFKVTIFDDDVDEIKNLVYNHVKKAIDEHLDRGGYLINLLLISRHLERIADHATNIAEEVIYMVEGEIIRHGNY